METKDLKNPQDCNTSDSDFILSYPKIDHTACTVCEECVEACPQDILIVSDNKIAISLNNGNNECDNCGKCVDICPMYAIEIK